MDSRHSTTKNGSPFFAYTTERSKVPPKGTERLLLVFFIEKEARQHANASESIDSRGSRECGG